jgi:kynureninase
MATWCGSRYLGLGGGGAIRLGDAAVARGRRWRRRGTEAARAAWSGHERSLAICYDYDKVPGVTHPSYRSMYYYYSRYIENVLKTFAAIPFPCRTRIHTYIHTLLTSSTYILVNRYETLLGNTL